MPLEIVGLDTLENLIRQTGGRAQDGIARQMKKEALKIQELAKKFAPVDYGNLEDAIEVDEEGGGRDDMGRFVRKSYRVFVDMNHPAAHGQEVGDYAYFIHEHMTPYGPVPLGPHSLEKQAGQAEMVGGLYMDRAVDEVMKGMMSRLVDVARTYID